MFRRPIINFVIIVLVLSSISTYSAQDDIPGENVSLYCQNGTSQDCCSHLAYRVAKDNHSRCASIALINNSGHDITLDGKDIEDGRWVKSEDYAVYGINGSVNCQPRSLPDGESETISSVTNRFLGGLTGYAFFVINDNMKSKFEISWKVPTIDVNPPEYKFSFTTKPSNDKYDVDKEKSFEDTVYQITISNNNTMSSTLSSLLPLISFIVLFLIIGFLFVILCYCIITRRLLQRVRPEQRFRSEPKGPAEPRSGRKQRVRPEPKGPAESRKY
jgi:hypothetical protein